MLFKFIRNKFICKTELGKPEKSPTGRQPHTYRAKPLDSHKLHLVVRGKIRKES